MQIVGIFQLIIYIIYYIICVFVLYLALQYLQYSSLLDELPAYKGGRDNTWRRLTLKGFHELFITYACLYYVSKTLRHRSE